MVALLQNLWSSFYDLFVPKQYLSWKTTVYLSLFSWIMSWLAVALGATAATIWVFISGSWIFLAFGVGWGLNANKVKPFGISIAPWVAGAILCGFLFGSWPGNQWELALTLWPLVSLLIIAAPQFFKWDMSFRGLPKPAERQTLILVLLLSLLLSSWFQMYFRMQRWLQDYPSLAADNFAASNFVYRVPGPLPQSEGIALLTLMEARVRERLANRPWSWAERWLLNIDQQSSEINREIRDQLETPTRELPFWQLMIQPYTRGEGYELKMRAVWQGPTAKPGSYYLEKTCQVRPTRRPDALRGNTLSQDSGDSFISSDPNDASLWTDLVCDLETPRLSGPPPS